METIWSLDRSCVMGIDSAEIPRIGQLHLEFDWQLWIRGEWPGSLKDT
jgi:hypothetical protein